MGNVDNPPHDVATALVMSPKLGLCAQDQANQNSITDDEEAKKGGGPTLS